MNNLETIVYMPLHDGTWVSKAFYEKIRHQVLDVLQAVQPDFICTLEMLCEPDFWMGLSDGQRRIAGKCMSHMVRHGILPFATAGKPCASPKRYRLI
jgi:hypothetical protein